MQVIVFASRKGGSGKTTLLAHLAVQALQGGEAVTIVDLDPQQNLKDWWEARPSDTLQLAQFPVAEFPSRLAVVRNQPGWLFVDTPGFEVSELRPLLEAADFVVIPVQPSPNDLRAVGQTVQVVKAVGRENFCFVVTRGITNARLTSETIAVLSHHGPVAPTIVANRVDYASSMANGRTIQEVDLKGKGAEETAQLWKYIQARMTSDSVAPTVQGSHVHV